MLLSELFGKGCYYPYVVTFVTSTQWRKVTMDTTLNIKPKVRISYDEMEAFLMLPELVTSTEKYQIADVMKELEIAGIRFGVKKDKVEQMINSRVYNAEWKIAEGIPAVDGVDGFYEFKFATNLDHKPKRKEDGTVDYWSVNAIAVVKAGQEIAIYHEPIEGSNGMSVKGKILFGKKGRPVPVLTGRGFERSADNKTYTASIDGTFP